jgi:hypothetical protein
VRIPHFRGFAVSWHAFSTGKQGWQELCILHQYPLILLLRVRDKMKALHFQILVLLVSLSLVRLPAKAALVQATDPRFGPNSLTIDTSTQLAWLDLTASAGLSYNQALADTAPGGIFSGYRFATVDEVRGLYSSAGIPGLGDYPLTNGPIQSLISLVGPSGVFQDWPAIFGITGSFTLAGSQPLQYTASISAVGHNGSFYYSVADPSGTDYGRDTGYSTVGNWLVMEVPEPSACSMTIGGLIGLAFVKRRKRQFFK